MFVNKVLHGNMPGRVGMSDKAQHCNVCVWVGGGIQIIYGSSSLPLLHIGDKIYLLHNVRSQSLLASVTKPDNDCHKK